MIAASDSINYPILEDFANSEFLVLKLTQIGQFYFCTTVIRSKYPNC